LAGKEAVAKVVSLEILSRHFQASCGQKTDSPVWAGPKGTIRQAWNRGRFAMRRRKLLVVLAGIAALLALPVVLLLAIPDSPRVSFGDYSRVQMGMTQAEVETIFGGPAPRNESLHWGPVFNGPNVPASAWIMLKWDGYEGHAGVTFDKAENVIDKSYTPTNPATRPGPLERRLDRLRQWWRSGIRD
jgi:hypothetical protein